MSKSNTRSAIVSFWDLVVDIVVSAVVVFSDW